MSGGISCDKCLMGYRPQDVSECPECAGEFCDGCMKNHDKDNGSRC